MARAGAVLEWLLDSDVSIRWQVMRDLLAAPEPVWAAERDKVATEGFGARLLSCEDEDGQWAGGAFVPAGFDPVEWRDVGQPFTATAFSLSQLRELGLHPASDRARRAVELIGASSRWDHGGEPYWQGEVEECINGRLVADGAYFGVDVAGTASGPAARSARRLPARSTCWRACSSTNGPRAGRPGRGRLAGRARSISSSAASSGG